MSRGIQSAAVLGFELVYVVVPGMAAYIATSGQSSLLYSLVVGIPIGLTLCVTMFLISKAWATLWLFKIYPFCVVPVLAAGFRHRWKQTPLIVTTMPAIPVLLGIIFFPILIAAWTCWSAYTEFPLPSFQPQQIDCSHDLIYFLSLTAELKNRWPPEFPYLAGEALHYHFFAYAHMAALATVTNISLESVVLQLSSFPLMGLLTLQMIGLGRWIGGTWAAGFASAGCLFLLQNVNPGPQPVSASQALFSNLMTSPSLLLGTTFFMALLAESAAIFREWLPKSTRPLIPDNRHLTWRHALVFILLFAGVTASKSSVAPAIIAAAGTMGLLLCFRGRRSEGISCLIFAVVGAATFFLGVRIIFQEAVHRLKFLPFHVMHYSFPYERGAEYLASLGLHTFIWHLLSGINLIVALVLWFLKDIVAIWAGWRHLSGMKPVCAFFITVAGLNTLAGLLLMEGGYGELYFILQAVIVLTPLSGVGLAMLFQPPWKRLDKILLAAVCLLFLLSTGVQTHHWVQRVRNLRQTAHYQFPSKHYMLDEQLYAALAWLRENTPKEAVVLSNVPTIADACYSAVSERRQVLEMLKMSTRWTAAGGHWDFDGPYQDRHRLVTAVFEGGDAGALREIARRFGAAYIFVDKKNGIKNHRLPSGIQLTYQNSAAAVYAIENQIHF